MPLTPEQHEKLRTIPQRAEIRIGVFPAFTLAVTDDAGGALTFKPMVRISPRYSMVIAGESIDLYGGDSYDRGGGGVSTWAWTVVEGTGIALVNASTATVTVTTSIETTAKIMLTVTGVGGSNFSYAYVKVYASGSKGFDGVAAVKSWRASDAQHGSEVELECRVSATEIQANMGILIWVQDYWAGVEDTFGGYKYPEGVFFGRVVGESIREDAEQSTVIFKVRSPYYILGAEVQNTRWAQSAATGVHSVADFRPVDALWHLLQVHTNFCDYHGVVLWYDTNQVANLQIDQADLWTIVEDVAERTFGIAFVDRYGELKVVPHQVVRADEWWGTPDPIMIFDEGMILEFEESGEREQAMAYVEMQALKADLTEILGTAGSKLNTGKRLTIKGLICDSAAALANWAADVYEWKNEWYWEVRLRTPLNHVLDIWEPVEVDYSHERTNMPQGAGSAYCPVWAVDSLEFEADVGTGKWTAVYHLVQIGEWVS